MRFASLGSGSRGNSTLVEARDTCLMIDCGFSIRETERRLGALGKHPTDISAILVTHEHSDHLKGVLPLASKYRLKVFMTAGCARHLPEDCELSGLEVIDSHNDFNFGDLKISPVPVPHDAREPVQYTIQGNDLRFGILTDLGSLTPHIENCYADCDGLLMEANHDQEMLANGPYPEYLQRRVGGNWGHLNNQQTATLLSRIDQGRLKQLVLGHISEKNNCLSKVRSAVEDVFRGSGQVSYATQREGFDWVSLET